MMAVIQRHRQAACCGACRRLIIITAAAAAAASAREPVVLRPAPALPSQRRTFCLLNTPSSKFSSSSSFSLPLSLSLSSPSLLLQSPRPPRQCGSAVKTNSFRASSSSSNSRWKQRQGRDMFAREAKVQGLKSRAAFKLLEMDSKFKLFKKGQVVVDLGYAPGSWSQVALERTKSTGRVLGIDIIPAQPPKGVSTIQGNFLSPGVQALVKRFLVEAHQGQEAEARRRKAKGEPPSQLFTGSADADASLEGGRASQDGGEEMAPGPDDDAVVNERSSYIDLERHAAAAELAVTDGDITGKAGLPGRRGKDDGKLVDIVLSDMMMNTSGIAFKDHAGSMDLCAAALDFANDTLRPGGHFVCKFYQGAEDRLLEARLRRLFARVHREKPESSRSESKEAYFVALRRKAGVRLEDTEE